LLGPLVSLPVSREQNFFGANMSEDIVTRLRKADKGLRQDIRSIPATSLGLLLEAADEIERLRKRVRDLQAGYKQDHRV
jgi:hypothetical protein